MEPKHKGWILFALLWCSLGLSNHHAFLLFVLPYSAWLIYKNTIVELLKPKYALAVLCGFSFYLLLPWAASKEPYFNWGSVNSWQGFWWHFLRKDFGTFSLSAGALTFEHVSSVALFVIKELFVQTHGLVLLFCLALWSLWRQKNELVWWGFAVLFYLVVFIVLGNLEPTTPVHQIMFKRFIMQLTTPLVLLGIWQLNSFLQKRVSFKGSVHIIAVIGLAVVGVHGFSREKYDETKDFLNFSELALKNLPLDAVVFTEGDHVTNPLRFLTQINGYRKDVIVIDRQMLTQKWYIGVLKKHYTKLQLPETGGGVLESDIVQLNPSRHFFLMNSFRGMPSSLSASYALWPEGVLEHILPYDQQPEFKSWIEYMEKLNSELAVLATASYDMSRWSYLVPLVYWIGRAKFAFRLFDLVQTKKVSEDYRQLVSQVLEDILKRDPDPQPVVHKILGWNYHFAKPQAQELLTRRNEVWHRYLTTDVGQKDPEREHLLSLIRASDPGH